MKEIVLRDPDNSDHLKIQFLKKNVRILVCIDHCGQMWYITKAELLDHLREK